MIEYTEQKNGSLSTPGRSIPAGNTDYKRALSLVIEGEATIEAWEGSQRQTDHDADKAISDWKASRAVAVEAINVEVDSMVFDGDEISQGRMARAVVASSSDTEQTVWVLANNTPVMVTALQLRQALKLAGLAQTALWVR